MNVILVVDDNEFIRESLSDILELSGYEIRVAENGTQAIQMVESHPIDIVIIDDQMPDISGTEVAMIIRRDYPAIRVFLMTGMPDYAFIQSTVKIGVDGYFSKPVKVGDLLHQLENRQ